MAIREAQVLGNRVACDRLQIVVVKLVVCKLFGGDGCHYSTFMMKWLCWDFINQSYAEEKTDLIWNH